MTRILVRIALGLFVAVALLVIVAAAVGLPQVRPVLIRQLGEALQCPVSMQAVVWVPPTGLGVRELEAQSPAGRTQPPWFKAAAVDVRVALWSLLSRRTFIADVDIVRPALTVERLADGRLSLPTFPPAAAPPTAEGPSASSPGPKLLPAHLRVRDGTVVYRDHRLTPPWSWAISKIHLDARVVPLTSVRYRGTGVIEGLRGAPIGRVAVDGETGLNGRTTATVTLAHRALPLLAPYVQQVMGAEPTAGELTLTATIIGRPEALTAKIHVETQDLAFQPGAMTSAGVTAAQLIPILEDAEHRISLDFTITGRWDQLQVGWNDLMANAVQQMLRTLVTQRLPNILLQGLTQALQPPAEGEASAPLDLKALGKRLTKTLKDSLLPADSSQDAQSPK